jgi:hypothetical protein
VPVEDAPDLGSAFLPGDRRPGIQHVDVGAGQEIVPGPLQEEHTHVRSRRDGGHGVAELVRHLFAVCVEQFRTVESDRRRAVGRFQQDGLVVHVGVRLKVMAFADVVMM